jgi:hypothetical protein
MSNPKLTKQILIETRDLIASPDNWTTGSTEYLDDLGKPRYCLGGALAKVAFGDPDELYSYENVGFFEEFVGASGIPHLEDDNGEEYTAWEATVYSFNDTSEHEDVLAALDKAIESVTE